MACRTLRQWRAEILAPTPPPVGVSNGSTEAICRRRSNLGSRTAGVDVAEVASTFRRRHVIWSLSSMRHVSDPLSLLVLRLYPAVGAHRRGHVYDATPHVSGSSGPMAPDIDQRRDREDPLPDPRLPQPSLPTAAPRSSTARLSSRESSTHVVWRRIGTHDIFDRP